MVAWKEMMMGAKMVEKSADWLESQLVENLVESLVDMWELRKVVQLELY
jgi:hypothetical protein